jgi:hypothetical protein
LSNWFPKIEAAGLPVPKTVVLSMPAEAQKVIWAAFDGEDSPDRAELDVFIARLGDACDSIGYPAFLRTGLISGKHSWKRTCFVTDRANLRGHVGELAEFSECADFLGLNWNIWVVREYLPVRPVALCRAYGDMPVCKEFRFFVDEGKVRCWHPYWPLHALERGRPDRDFDFAALCNLEDVDLLELTALAERAGKAVGGSWSIDILDTARGWFVTDMAEANKSFHWEGCETTQQPKVSDHQS